MYAQSLGRLRLFAAPWTVAGQVPLSMGILQGRILEWVAISYSGGLPDPGIKHPSLASPALAGGFLALAPPGKQHVLNKKSRSHEDLRPAYL